MNNSIMFKIVTGVNKGYKHNNCDSCNLDMVGKLWQKIAKEEFDNSGIYISAIINESKAIYNEEWGCPKGGEDTVTISGTANKEFIDDLDNWKDQVIIIAKRIKVELGQTTLTCEFINSEFYYFK